MKKLVAALVCLLSSSAWATGGNATGNGGAGIQKDGRYMTFYSAGLYTEPNPMDGVGQPIPGLSEYISFVQRFPYWNSYLKSGLIQAAMPGTGREYYAVRADQFDDKTRTRLLSEFSKAIGQTAQPLTLFAVTDVDKGQTFLLPEFYQLNAAEQAAIIFHETLWAARISEKNYAFVVNAEMAFQAAYTHPDDSARALNLLNYVASPNRDFDYELQLSAKADLESGALDGLLVNGEIPLSKLLGDAVMNCRGSDCVAGMARVGLYNLRQQYPKSYLLKRLQGHSQPHQGSQQVLDPPGYTAGNVAQLAAFGKDCELYRQFGEITSRDLNYRCDQLLDLSRCSLSLNLYQGAEPGTELLKNKSLIVHCDSSPDLRFAALLF